MCMLIIFSNSLIGKEYRNNVLRETKGGKGVFYHWIIVKCHIFVSNLVIVKNVWTTDTAPLTLICIKYTEQINTRNKHQPNQAKN